MKVSSSILEPTMGYSFLLIMYGAKGFGISQIERAMGKKRAGYREWGCINTVPLIRDPLL